MRCLLVGLAAFALVLAAGACGSIIGIPDQGVIVIGCMTPNACYFTNCSCKRADAQLGGKCTTGNTCTNPLDPSTCVCPSSASFTEPFVPADMSGLDMSGPIVDMSGLDMRPPPPKVISVPTVCEEAAQLCVGRGDFCGGVGARCLPTGMTCAMSGGDPPELISAGGVGPALEPHCQYVDDVCCPGQLDGGVTD